MEGEEQLKGARQENDSTRLEDDSTHPENDRQSANEPLGEPSNGTNADPIDRVEFIRFLLSLTQKMDQSKMDLISMTLCYELIRPTGVCNLINASIDLDESSQKLTTHNQRFLKLSMIIAGLPKLCCPLERFFGSVCDQLIRILLNTSDERRTSQTTKLINALIATICCALYRRSKRLFEKKFLSVIYACFSPEGRAPVNEGSSQEGAEQFSNELEEEFRKKVEEDRTAEESKKEAGSVKLKFEDDAESASELNGTTGTSSQTSSSDQMKKDKPISRLKIDESIRITLLLLLNRFEKKEILKYFKQFFYVRCVLHEVNCSLSSDLDKLLGELLTSISSSQYLLDKTLFGEQNLNEFDRYQVQLDIERGVRTVVLRAPDSVQPVPNNEVELKKIDQITQCTVKLICSRPDSYKIDAFLLFLQRYSQKQERTVDYQRSLLLCSLIDTLMKNIITPEGLIMLINFPDKAIDFVNLTLERLTLSYDSDIFEQCTQTGRRPEDEQLENSIKEDSLNMCLQIIDFVLKKQLFQSLFETLKRTLDNFVAVASKGEFSEEIKKRATDLQEELRNKQFISVNKYQEDTVFKQAIQDMNSNLMPERAHALITLKKLIYAKNSNIQTNKAQLITVLTECLQDAESYIYLSAINTLAALALVHTDEVLPILIDSFNDKHRAEMDRLKVGQVIVYLSKQLNEMAACYAKPIMNMLLRASRDECDLIRVSTLSNLAEFCSVLGFKLNVYITEIMVCLEYTLKSDPSIEVKRACIMFFHLLLNNLDAHSLAAIESELRNMYSLLKNVYNTTLDDLIQLHAQLALEQLNRIAKEILQSMRSVPTEVRFQLK